ncbi:hypothetical protein H2200_005278 [Cladophialophora chaetospira]|uniref:Uncharacterized protein n=1 Tax=Cladophialophora chaetospira TaxID=386627 RepID=A0AA39CJN9_9EURO|nr:hypothetical protein H2200_005278 [Cladophialophora chaetospira]
MAIKEIFYFDEEAYRQRVHNYGKEGFYQKLAEREVFKRRRIYSTGVKIVICSILLVPTCGSTGMGLFIGLRQRAVAKKKYQHVVDAMRAHEFPLPKPKKADKLVPLAINIVVYSLTLGLMFGLEEVGLVAANETAGYGLQGTANLVDPSMAGEARQFVANPGDFVQGMFHGAHTQVSELHGLVSPNQTMVGHAVMHHMAQPISETSAQYMSGETAGAQLAPVVERVATVTLASEGLERLAKSSVTGSIRRKPVVGDKAAIITETPINLDGRRVVTEPIRRKPVFGEKVATVTESPVVSEVGKLVAGSIRRKPVVGEKGVIVTETPIILEEGKMVY